MLCLKTLLSTKNGKIDFTDKSVTENTRYPPSHITLTTSLKSGSPLAGHAKKVIFLTVDAFGVFLPYPSSLLSRHNIISQRLY